jgi:diguanylate cyclase (GGDEF)-like protein
MLAGALFVDIDRLQDVNEKLGTAAGDQLLRIVGERLQRVVRAHDTVGRLGGDEFVILVESAARGIRLDSLARRIIEALHKPVELDDFGPSFVLTASIGVAFGRYATPEDMLRDARLALASAKAAGKDRYTLFNANMRTVIEGRAVLEVELNAALAQQQFFLLYQPIFDLGTRRMVGLESVIRWQHPTQGVVAPADFIPLAQETGLIVPIGRWALEEACGRAAAWNVDGHRVGVSVKVSPQQLNRDGFTTDVKRALQQSGIEPSLLTLEIAEATVMRDVVASTKRLEEIKQLGVRIAIDDFDGGGHANHSELRQMPLDFLRVDRSSLAASEDENYRRWLLESIFVVGRELSLTVIATGIETEEQMNAIQALGCTMAQGFFLGQPIPLEDVEALFDVELPAPAPTLVGPIGIPQTSLSPVLPVDPTTAQAAESQRIDSEPHS